MIAARRQSAGRAVVPPIREDLGYGMAARTGLRRAARVNLYNAPTSLFRFVVEHCKKPGPPCIVNRLRQHPQALLHFLVIHMESLIGAGDVVNHYLDAGQRELGRSQSGATAPAGPPQGALLSHQDLSLSGGALGLVVGTLALRRRTHFFSRIAAEGQTAPDSRLASRFRGARSR